mgnify:CR=1 FL=1|jgi:hypothetical protein
MKSKFFTSILAIVVLSLAAAAQTGAVKEADPADVSSVDAIMKAVYDVISGDAGEKRDWERFRSLFHPSARLIPTGKNPNTGEVIARAMTPDEYVQRNEPFFAKEGFHEREVARTTETYGNIAHIFSTYESFKTRSDKKPFMRGINSFQLLYDGKRWWIMNIFWQAETPDNQIPKKYLKGRN